MAVNSVLGRSHLFIPDTQVTHGGDISHIKAAGRLIMDRKPDVIVIIGDWWDMESMSTFTPAQKIGYDRLSYKQDYDAGIKAMKALFAPMKKYNEKMRKGKRAQYKPELVFTLGNHEFRVDRLLAQNVVLEGTLPRVEDWLKEYGFAVTPYCQATVIDGVTYSHNCPQTSSAGCVSRAHLIMQKRNASWSVGHSQILDYYVSPHFPRLQCLILGAFYTHDESYKIGSNDHFRGLAYKTNVKDGTYDLELLSIDGLMHKYP